MSMHACVSVTMSECITCHRVPNGRRDSPSGRELVHILWGVCKVCSEYQTPDQGCEMQSEPEVAVTGQR